MKINVSVNADEMGKASADLAAEEIARAIDDHGECRIMLSTGASQFEFFNYLTKKDLPWDRVIGFHLDEFVNMEVTHPASFRKYMKERFVDKVHPKEFHYVDGTGNVEENIAKLTTLIREKPIDLGLIGIGENGHIAFNDPPADFDTKEAYHIVKLDDKCRHQQFGAGWFKTLDEVPKKAVSMTVYQIMQCNTIITVCGGLRKADAIQKTLDSEEITNQIPATKLKEHPRWYLFLDKESASKVKSIEL